MPAASTISPGLWRDLNSVVGAAHRRDMRGYRSAVRRLSRKYSLEQQNLAGIWVQPLLTRAVIEAVGGIPSAEDIDRLCSVLWDDFRTVVGGGDPHLLHDALAYEFSDVELLGELAFRDYCIAGSVALGLLLADPNADLDRMKPWAQEWIDKRPDYVADMLHVERPG